MPNIAEEISKEQARVDALIEGIAIDEADRERKVWVMLSSHEKDYYQERVKRIVTLWLERWHSEI